MPTAGALAFVLGACATPGPTPPPAARAEERVYLVKELPVNMTARVEEPGEKELRARVRHDRHTTELSGEAEFAPVDGLQFDVEVPYAFHHGAGAPDDGVPAVEFGARAEVWSDPHELALTMGAKVTAPVDETQTNYEVRALLARSFGDFELHGSAAVEWDAHDHAFPWSLAAVGRLQVPTLFPTLELYGAGTAAALAPGLVWRLDDHMEAAIGVPLRMRGSTEDIGVVLGFLIEW